MTVRFLLGDTRDVLRILPDQSVDLVLTSPPFLALRSYLPADHPDKGREIGSEADPGAFIDVLLDLVEEWDRVLAPHGSICVELGDTYGGHDNRGSGVDRGRHDAKTSVVQCGPGWPLDKSLCLIPESFRWALAYGRNPFTGRTTPSWRVRNVVRWCRPNPPVGALGDKWRPATSDLVIACKSSRRYWDDLATRKPHQSDPTAYTGNGYTKGAPEGVPGNESMPGNPGGAPLNDWWKVSTASYSGSHYAVMPEALAVPPILAMCPERVCRVCGEPSRRITENPNAGTGRNAWNGSVGESGFGDRPNVAERITLGWSDCGHDNYRTGVVLDPFGGSGTTGAVAQGLGRDAILVDLDERNLDLARERIGMFLTTEPARRPA